MSLTIIYQARTYTATKMSDMDWTFTAHGVTLNHTSDMDLEAEFGTCATSWAQHIDDLMMEAGAVVYDEDHGYITEENLEEAENEARWNADHIRQESRSDIFI